MKLINFSFCSSLDHGYKGEKSRKPRQKKIKKFKHQKPYQPIRASMKQKRQQQKQNRKFEQYQKSLISSELYLQLINDPKHSITTAIKLLNRIVNDKAMEKKQFQQNVWKKYSYYIVMIAEKDLQMLSKCKDQQSIETDKLLNNQYEQESSQLASLEEQSLNQNKQALPIHHKLTKFQKQQRLRLKFLDLIVSVHEKFAGELQSVHLTKIFNKYFDYFLQKEEWKSLKAYEKISVILSLSRYNIKKASIIFLKRKGHILDQKDELQNRVEDVFNLLDLMERLQIKDSQVLEMIIDLLQDQINWMSLHKIERLAFWLSKQSRFNNKTFFKGLIKRFDGLTKGQNIMNSDVIRILHVLSSFTIIQYNVQLGHYQPLDLIYQRLFPYINSFKLSNYKSKFIVTFAMALKNSPHFDPTILNNIATQCMSRSIVELHDKFVKFQDRINDKATEFNSITFSQLTQVFLTFASLNYTQNKTFLEYYHNILMLIQNDQNSVYTKYIPTMKLFGRLISSIFVLFTQQQIHKLLPLIQHFFRQTSQIQPHQVINLYYCYLLLKGQYPNSQIQWQNNRVQKYLQSEQNKTEILETKKQVYHNFLEAGISLQLSYNINDVVCDFYIPKYHEMKDIIIQIHGFHNYVRNQKRINGATALKQKFIEKQGYLCFYIAIDEWLIAQDKLEFIKTFMSEIVQGKYSDKTKKQEQRNNSKRLQQKIKYLNNQNNKKIKQTVNRNRNILEQIKQNQGEDIIGLKRLGRTKKMDLIE